MASRYDSPLIASSQSYGCPFWPLAVATSQATIKVTSTTSPATAVAGLVARLTPYDLLDPPQRAEAEHLMPVMVAKTGAKTQLCQRVYPSIQ